MKHSPSSVNLADTLTPTKIELTLAMNAFTDAFKSLDIECTKTLKGIAKMMILSRGPVSINDLRRCPELKSCNPTTLYRAITRLEKVDLVKRVGLHTRAVRYLLKLPQIHQDYLFCSSCGDTTRIQTPNVLPSLCQEMSTLTEWTSVKLQVEAFGICPQCQSNTNELSADDATRDP